MHTHTPILARPILGPGPACLTSPGKPGRRMHRPWALDGPGQGGCLCIAPALLALEHVFRGRLCPWQTMLHVLTVHCKWADLGARPPALDGSMSRRFLLRHLASTQWCFASRLQCRGATLLHPPSPL